MSVSPNRTILQVQGPVSSIETAFNVQIHEYLGKDGRRFHAPDRVPSVPASLSGALFAIVGLDNAAYYHAPPPYRRPAISSPLALPLDVQPLNLFYSGGGGLTPSDIRKIYNLNSVTERGSGQTLGLFEFSSYTTNDILTYEANEGLGNVPLQNIGVNGYSTTSTPNGAVGEVELDIELQIALSPSAAKIIVYEEADAGTLSSYEQTTLDLLNRMATDDAASVLSSSYDQPEQAFPTSYLMSENTIFQQMMTQGQTFCVASGDAGAYGDQSAYPNGSPNTYDPASQPLILSVGGTSLTDNSSIAYVSETSWADHSDTSRGMYGTGGGGGISSYWTIPSYQNGAFSPTVNPQGSTTMRNIPDVSLFGDFDTGNYDFYLTDAATGRQIANGANGTSAAAPLWSAFLADVNEARLANGLPKLGLANTAIYAIV